MYERIVVGTDGSDEALAAVRTAGRLAALDSEAELHIVTAVRNYTAADMARIHEALPAEFHDVVNPSLDAQDRFDEARSLIDPAIDIIPHRADGSPADSILAVADGVDADLIVVGARGLGTVERFLRGSVSTKVAHHATCDVLIVERDTR